MYAVESRKSSHPKYIVSLKKRVLAQFIINSEIILFLPKGVVKTCSLTSSKLTSNLRAKNKLFV